MNNIGMAACSQCGCIGNASCTYPPTNEEMDAGFDDCALDQQFCCPCCKAGIDRMMYRPQEDGQDDLPWKEKT